MIKRYSSEFIGAEEIVAKQNKDGTYHVTLKTTGKEEGTNEEYDIVVKIPRGSVSVEALVCDDATVATYTVVKTEKPIRETDLLEHTHDSENWELLGYVFNESQRSEQEVS